MVEEVGGWRGTTVVAVRRGKQVALAADGQVSYGAAIIKSSASKLRQLAEGRIIAGFSGATADSLTLFERLEGKLEQFHHNLARACVELAKDWRTDRYLRRLEAMMLVCDRKRSLLLTGAGDVMEPDGDAAAIGSGGPYALAAARALLEWGGDGDAEQIARRALQTAARICVYTNEHINVLALTGGDS